VELLADPVEGHAVGVAAGGFADSLDGFEIGFAAKGNTVHLIHFRGILF
jgi:hypothetical protein